MNVIKRMLFVSLIGVISSGCQRYVNTDHAEHPIELTAQIEQAYLPVKNSSTAFVDGDQLGLYAIKSGQELSSAGNMIDNALFTADRGNIVSTPPIYYPDRTTTIDFYSYYPYQPVLANALEVFFGIHTDQADFSSHCASDLCRGMQRGVRPTSSASSIVYRHVLSRVVFDLTVPASIGGRLVSKVASVTLLDVIDSVTMNLATADVVNHTARADVLTYTQSATQFVAIVPAQQLRAGQVARVTVDFVDGSTEDYVYHIASPIDLVQGSTNTFSLTIGDKANLSIDQSPTISAWTTVNSSGAVNEVIDNQFSVLWRLPNPRYATVASIALSVFDPNSGLTHDFTTTNFQYIASNSSSQMAAYKFDLKLPISSGVAYPYTIKSMKFIDGSGGIVQQCDAIVAANVTRSGDYTIGVEQSIVLNIVSGTVTKWDDLVGNGSISGMVENSFRLQLIEPSLNYVEMLARVRFRIKGVDYYFAPVTSSGNMLLQATTNFSLPDLTGKIPSVYPYIIEQIGMQRVDGSEVQTVDAGVMVTRSGDITLQICRGVVVMLSSSVSGYGEATSSGEVEYEGPVGSNLFSVVYCAGSATSVTSCMNVKKVRLTVNGAQIITLGDYTMSGTQFSASSLTGIDIKSSAACPALYPYVVNKVEFLDAASVVLSSVAPSEPIKIVRSGAVTLRIME